MIIVDLFINLLNINSIISSKKCTISYSNISIVNNDSRFSSCLTECSTFHLEISFIDLFTLLSNCFFDSKSFKNRSFNTFSVDSRFSSCLTECSTFHLEISFIDLFTLLSSCSFTFNLSLLKLMLFSCNNSSIF